MYGLLKQQEHEIKLEEQAKERSLDRARGDFFGKVYGREGLNDIQFKSGNLEKELEKKAQAKEDRKRKEDIVFCEQSLSRELSKRKLENDREFKMRQLLWETAPELRELRKKLLIADVTKDQVMQVAEKRAITELKKKEDEVYALQAQREKEEYEAQEQRKEVAAHQAKLKYHRELDNMREYKVRKEKRSEEQIELEKSAIDEMRKLIVEQDLKDAEIKLKKQKELQRQAEEFKKVKDERILKEKLQNEEVELKADEYRKAQELRSKEQEVKKQLSLEHKVQMQEALLTYLEDIYQRKYMQDMLRTELAIEEREAAEKVKASDDEKKKLYAREELEKLYDIQIYLKKQKEATEKKAEELYRETLMAKLYEDDKLELMSRQKQHLKKIEHRREVQATIEENRKKKVVEKARELADQKYIDAIEAERMQLVNEEKIKFIKENAGELLGYLPKGILEDEKTVELLGEEFKKFYTRKSCNE